MSYLYRVDDIDTLDKNVFTVIAASDIVIAAAEDIVKTNLEPKSERKTVSGTSPIPNRTPNHFARTSRTGTRLDPELEEIRRKQNAGRDPQMQQAPNMQNRQTNGNTGSSQKKNMDTSCSGSNTASIDTTFLKAAKKEVEEICSKYFKKSELKFSTKNVYYSLTVKKEEANIAIFNESLHNICKVSIEYEYENNEENVTVKFWIKKSDKIQENVQVKQDNSKNANIFEFGKKFRNAILGNSSNPKR